jgi:hypothetical protein
MRKHDRDEIVAEVMRRLKEERRRRTRRLAWRGGEILIAVVTILGVANGFHLL